MTHDTAPTAVSYPVHVVAMGVSGCGKSTVGEALARRLGVPFEDGDDLHPPANVEKMRAGTPLDDDDRWPWLAAVGDWLAGTGEAGGVVACSALKRSYRDVLREHAPSAVFVHLHGDRDLIARRQAARGQHFMPPGLLESQFATLEPLAGDEPGVVLDVVLGVDELVDAAYAALTTDAATGGTPEETS
ncbi:gluconokinase [Nocardioides sp. CFH 31398]|uniref:gluconokinase n=1 Tax=Nocardioides sp. CFH 31398 TaxID=2919579 RepID=UPI001F05DB02|nr:gluconokinase [Nocardioides sp. CFH 31398]MCH1868146.1 gluconokinase [Nocardioides sp. CFH 31398]